MKNNNNKVQEVKIRFHSGTKESGVPSQYASLIRRLRPPLHLKSIFFKNKKKTLEVLRGLAQHVDVSSGGEFSVLSVHSAPRIARLLLVFQWSRHAVKILTEILSRGKKSNKLPLLLQMKHLRRFDTEKFCRISNFYLYLTPPALNVKNIMSSSRFHLSDLKQKSPI